MRRQDERWLSQVWERQSFERRNLRTTSGLAFKVVFPGLCTGEAGPDFRDAILALADGSLLRGDVELHLESSGWRQHGHHRDRAYDRVLLHVVLEDNEPVHNSSGEPVLTVELAGRLRPHKAPLLASAPREPRHISESTSSAYARTPGPTSAAPSPAPSATLRAGVAGEGWGEGISSSFASHPHPNPLPPAGEGIARPHPSASPAGGLLLLEAPAAGVQLSYVVAPCQRRLPRKGLGGVREVIIRLALERFQAKQAVFEGELAVFPAEQVLYTGLLEALGYSRNQAPFRRLAEVAPIGAIVCAGGAERIEELLLAAAGLGGADAAVIMAEAGLVGEPLPEGMWRTLGVRPENLPRRRIRQFAAVLARLLRGGILDELLSPLLDCDDGAACGQAPKRARVPRREWRRLLAELGQQRAGAMAVNVLLPFAAAYGQATCQFMLSDLAVQAFLAYPAEGANQVTGYMRHDILGALSPAASGAAGEQGLLHVWDRWCHEKVCALCPLGLA